MRELINDPFYEKIKAYNRCIIDYCLMESDTPHQGYHSHLDAILFALDKFNERYTDDEPFLWSADIEKAEAKCIDSAAFLHIPDDYKSQSAVFGGKLPYWYAFLKTPHRNGYGKDDFLKINDILHHPVKAYISSYIPAGILGGVFVVVVILLWYFGIIEKGFPYYTIEVTICFVLMVAVLPLAVAYEIRNRYVKSVEKQLPEVLREISDMRDVGMTLQGAINMISGHKRGVLSTEIRMVSEEVKYGASLSSALVRMEERVGLTTVKRAISLLVRASEVTDYIREILAIAIADLEHYLKMKNKRFNVSFVYLAIIYLSVGIFLFAAYEMNVAFINSFSSFNMAINTGNSAEQMFIIGIILAFFSGIMAGQLSANTILSGLKHSIVMLAMTIVTFVILVGVR